MPISAHRMKLYPGGGTHSKEWKAFRASLLLRADNCCEGTPQHPECRAVNGEPHPETGGRVVLTIAHMDHDESHADPERCRALCQRCHNKWDAPHRRVNAGKTRRSKLPQLDLVDMLTFTARELTSSQQEMPDDFAAALYENRSELYWDAPKSTPSTKAS